METTGCPIESESGRRHRVRFGFPQPWLAAGSWPFSCKVAAYRLRSWVSYAIVQDDGSLRVQGKTIRLFESTCRRPKTVPKRLPSSSVLQSCGAGAERSRFAGWFAANRKRSSWTTALSAVCDVDGNSTADAPLDPGAWLIEQGLWRWRDRECHSRTRCRSASPRSTAVAYGVSPFRAQALTGGSRCEGRIRVDPWTEPKPIQRCPT